MHYIPNGKKAGYHLPRQGGVAFAAQESWVLNETIKVSTLGAICGAPIDRCDRKIFYLERLMINSDIKLV